MSLVKKVERPALVSRLYEKHAGRGEGGGTLDRDALTALWREEARGLYSLRFFTAEYCAKLLEEVEHFEAFKRG